MALTQAGPAPTVGQGNFTGRQKEALERQYADQLAERQREISLNATVVREQQENTIIDMTDPDVKRVISDEVVDASDPNAILDEGRTVDLSKQPRQQSSPAPVDLTGWEDIIEDDDVNRNAPETEIIRLFEKVEDMTFGVGRHFTFEAGVKYKVEKGLADRLRELGYIQNY